MKDEDLERRLRRYEPVSPPASLRARIVGGRTNRRRTWPWAAAAAALLAVTVWLASSAERVMQRIDGNVDVAASQRSVEVEALAEMIEGSENPRALAEWMIERRDADRALESPRQAVGTTGVAR